MPVQIAITKGKCQDHVNEIGQVFTVDETTPEGMCMGAWNAIAPYVTTLLYCGNFPWEKEKGFALIHCPDPKGITILIERVERK